MAISRARQAEITINWFLLIIIPPTALVLCFINRFLRKIPHSLLTLPSPKERVNTNSHPSAITAVPGLIQALLPQRFSPPPTPRQRGTHFVFLRFAGKTKCKQPPHAALSQEEGNTDSQPPPRLLLLKKRRRVLNTPPSLCLSAFPFSIFGAK